MSLEKYHILSSYFVNLLINDYLFKLDFLIKYFVLRLQTYRDSLTLQYVCRTKQPIHISLLSAPSSVLVGSPVAQWLKHLTGDPRFLVPFRFGAL